NFLALFQFRDIVAQSCFELVLRVKSQLRARPRNVHARTRGSQFSAADPSFRKYFSERFFDVCDRSQRATTKVVNLVRQWRRMHNESDAVGEILGIDEIDTLV